MNPKKPSRKDLAAASVAKHMGARLLEINMPTAIWMNFPPQARHCFYQGQGFLVTWKNVDGTDRSVAKIYPGERLPDAAFDPKNWK